MSWLSFFLARYRRDERVLAEYSIGWAALDAFLGNKSIAIVGNARALANHELGADIDAHDLVLRINSAPMPNARSHGNRCDVLALSIPVPAERIVALDPLFTLWMTRKRKRLPHALARRAGFYLNPLSDWQPLADRLGAPPSTGAMAIGLLARSGASTITLFGFDFFSSKSLSGGRDAAQVPHDFVAEADWVRDLLSRDARFRLEAL